MSIDKTTVEKMEMAETLYSLTDRDFYEVFMILGDKHGININGEENIETFVSWLKDVLLEIKENESLED